MDKDTTRERVKGKYNEAAGETRQRAGRAIGNEQLEAEGHAQEMKGKVQDKTADVKEAAEDVKDAARKVASYYRRLCRMREDGTPRGPVFLCP